MHALDKTEHWHFLAELDALDQEMIDVDGKQMKPSQCYHVSVDPTHVLFNANCPDSLRERISDILKRYRYQ